MAAGVDDLSQEFSTAPLAISSALEQCELGKASLMSTLQPHLTDFPQPLDAEGLKEAVHELIWLRVAKNQGAATRQIG
jgi:hypothetical protein